MNIAFKPSVLLMLYSVYGAANAVNINASAETVIRTIHPGGTIEQVVNGDLDNDGLDDIGYVVSWYAPSKDHELVIGVLRGRPDNTFVSWTHTKRFVMGQRSPEVEIRGKSFYISTMTNGLSWGNWETAQYSFRAGGLVLIGEEGLYRSPRLDYEPGPVTTKTTSTNHLSCREISSVTERKKRTESVSKVENCKLRPLEDFE
jgi:hypothetical protein